MRVIADRARCEGHGICVNQAPGLLDLDDDSEQLVRIVGEAQPPDANSDVLPVSATSPMGEALMKRQVGETIKVRAPRGTLAFKILEIM